jgi:hypothetical protein
MGQSISLDEAFSKFVGAPECVQIKEYIGEKNYEFILNSAKKNYPLYLFACILFATSMLSVFLIMLSLFSSGGISNWLLLALLASALLCFIILARRDGPSDKDIKRNSSEDKISKLEELLAFRDMISAREIVLWTPRTIKSSNIDVVAIKNPERLLDDHGLLWLFGTVRWALPKTVNRPLLQGDLLVDASTVPSPALRAQLAALRRAVEKPQDVPKWSQHELDLLEAALGAAGKSTDRTREWFQILRAYREIPAGIPYLSATTILRKELSPNLVDETVRQLIAGRYLGFNDAIRASAKSFRF